MIVTIELPPALEHWTNEQVLNFIHLMWEQSNQFSGTEAEFRDVDPLQFLGDTSTSVGPVDAITVVEVAKQAYSSLGENSYEVFSRRAVEEYAFNSPLTEDAIMDEGADGICDETVINGIVFAPPVNEGDGTMLLSTKEGFFSAIPTKSFVAAPALPAKATIPDPLRKKRIVAWLCKSIEHLNELSQLPFNSGELSRLHQHYFTPVVNEYGGSVNATLIHESADIMGRVVNSVPDVLRHAAISNDNSMVTPSTQFIEEHSIPASDPSMHLSPLGAQLTMLKRKVSYRFLGDAENPTSRSEERRVGKEC